MQTTTPNSVLGQAGEVQTRLLFLSVDSFVSSLAFTIFTTNTSRLPQARGPLAVRLWFDRKNNDMGLFDFLKPKKIDRAAIDNIARLDIKSSLDEIQQAVCDILKPQGFKKKGRIFNREIEKGLIQVINFQSGQYPIGEYEISGLTDNLYGKFTVNLGVCVESLYRFQFPNQKKTFYKEYECQQIPKPAMDYGAPKILDRANNSCEAFSSCISFRRLIY